MEELCEPAPRAQKASHAEILEVLKQHIRMSGRRPFYAQCVGCKWQGPNTKFSDHLASELEKVIK